MSDEKNTTKLTKWQRFNDWRRGIMQTKLFKFLDYLLWFSLLMWSWFAIGNGCGKTEVWEQGIKEGYAVKENGNYKWKKPDAEQTPTESK